MNILKLSISFILILLIGISSAVFAISKMLELSDNTKRIYYHPFTVSNAVADIQTSIITIHRNMKDVVLSKSNLDILKLVEQVQSEEEKVYKNFDTIYKSYLGNKKNIDTSYELYKQWKPIREEVIVNMTDGKVEEAIAITRGKGAKHIENLYQQIAVLKKFAFGKANEFFEKSVKNSGIKEVITSIVLAILLSVIIVFYIVFTLLKASRESQKQLYLIDQNILMAKLSLDKRVVDISSSFCRILGQKKENIIGKKEEYFFTSEEQYMTFENLIISGKEYSGEVCIKIDDEPYWFNMEIFPELDNLYNINFYSIFLTNITDKKKIEKISITDTLTGIYNRNYFEMIFDKEVKRAKRDTKALTMVMLDIDFFKQFNDAYGHQEGDKVLKSVSHSLSSRTHRSYDHSFRIGGEEFVVLTYQKSYNEAKDFAGNLIQDIEALKISHKKSEISDYLTISAGVIYFEPSHLLSPDEMFKKTDQLLYEAKRDGRNRYKSEMIN